MKLTTDNHCPVCGYFHSSPTCTKCKREPDSNPPTKGRVPSYERGCKGKIKLGRKKYKKNADRLAKKYGHTLGVYWCPWCGNHHATSKITNEKIYEGLIYVATK